MKIILFYCGIWVKRETEAVVGDLVREYIFQLEPEKREISGIRLDSPEEILATNFAHCYRVQKFGI